MYLLEHIPMRDPFIFSFLHWIRVLQKDFFLYKS